MVLAYPEPDLTDEVVRVRRWRETDIECIRQAATDPGILEGTTVPAVFTSEAALAFFARQWQRAEDNDGLSMAIADRRTDEARGLLWLAWRPQPGVVGLGYWIVPAARRRGFGGHAVGLGARWALRVAGMARVEAWVQFENTASQRLFAGGRLPTRRCASLVLEFRVPPSRCRRVLSHSSRSMTAGACGCNRPAPVPARATGGEADGVTPGGIIREGDGVLPRVHPCPTTRMVA